MHQLIRVDSFPELYGTEVFILTLVTGVLSGLLMCLLAARELRNWKYSGFLANFLICGCSVASFVLVFMGELLKDADGNFVNASTELIEGLDYYIYASFACGVVGFLSEFVIVGLSCLKKKRMSNSFDNSAYNPDN